MYKVVFMNKLARTYSDKQRQTAKEEAIRLALNHPSGPGALSRKGLDMYMVKKDGSRSRVTRGKSYDSLWHDSLGALRKQNNKTAKLEHKPEPTRDSPEGKELLRIRGILRRAKEQLGEGTSVFLAAGSNKYPGVGGEVTKGSARDPYIASHAKLHKRWAAQQGYSKWGKKPLPQAQQKNKGFDGYVRIKVRNPRGQHLQHHFVRANKWGLPAGGIDRGEAPRNAAARELLERTGYKVNPEALSEAGKDSKGFHLFETSSSNLTRVAKPGELGGYKTKVRWEAQQGAEPGKSELSNVARHTRKLRSGKRIEVKPHTRKRSGNLENRYPEIKFKRNVSRINNALKIKARRGYSTPNEPLHIKYGPKVHFGVGRHGAHFGVYGKGPTEHFYSDRVHVGGAKKGTTYQLTPGQKKEVKGLMKKRDSLRLKKTALAQVVPGRKAISTKEMAKIAGFGGALLDYLRAYRPQSKALQRLADHGKTVEKFKGRVAGKLATDVPGTGDLRMFPKKKAEELSRLAVEHPLAFSTLVFAPGGSLIAPPMVGMSKGLTRALRKRTKEKLKLLPAPKEKVSKVLSARGVKIAAAYAGETQGRPPKPTPVKPGKWTDLLRKTPQYRDQPGFGQAKPAYDASGSLYGHYDTTGRLHKIHRSGTPVRSLLKLERGGVTKFTPMPSKSATTQFYNVEEYAGGHKRGRLHLGPPMVSNRYVIHKGGLGK